MDFGGGNVTSNGGALFFLVWPIAPLEGLSHRITRCIPDKRRRSSCIHSLLHGPPGRLQLVSGYEDLIDQQTCATTSPCRLPSGRQAPCQRFHPWTHRPPGHAGPTGSSTSF
ncbi:MAG: hypothetical protein IPN71_18690 [Fibrobacteres bacterium]|nr:hypothetical protein [Fibrobacterota bacterium]